MVDDVAARTTPPAPQSQVADVPGIRELKIELLDALRYLREERNVRGAQTHSVTVRIVELERDLGR